MNNFKKGSFIVIDGIDGTGKATQTKCLVERLNKEGRRAISISFPRHGLPSATMADLYLEGKLGGKELTSNPYLVSAFYAADRYLNAHEIREALNQGTTVVCDRYVAANMGHQGSKIESDEERKLFFEWLYDYEYKKLGIPFPDINIVLHVPLAVSIGLVQKRGLPRDSHEKDDEHLRKAREVYLQLPQLFPDTFTAIECYRDDTLYTPDQIHELVWEKVSPLL